MQKYQLITSTGKSCWRAFLTQFCSVEFPFQLEFGERDSLGFCALNAEKQVGFFFPLFGCLLTCIRHCGERVECAFLVNKGKLQGFETMKRFSRKICSVSALQLRAALKDTWFQCSNVVL